MPAPVICGVIYLAVSAVMLVPAFVPWAAVPLEQAISATNTPTWSPTTIASGTTHSPSLVPSFSPSISSVNRPSLTPTATTFSPSAQPSPSPTLTPTTTSPSLSPSRSPTSSPSLKNSTSVSETDGGGQQTGAPSTGRPTRSPNRPGSTRVPTTTRPTKSPVTSRPSRSPATKRPTKSPTAPTTARPTRSPRAPVTSRPTKSPTIIVNFASSLRQQQQEEVAGQTNVLEESLAMPSKAVQDGGSSGGDVRLLWLLWLWPCVSYLLMGLSYLLDDPRDVTRHRSYGAMLLGKELDGSMRWYCVIPMLPVLIPTWIIWLIRHSTCLRHEKPFNEIVPGIYLGRFPRHIPLCSKWSENDTFPSDATIIVDLEAEMPVPRHVFKTRRYLCIPTLDQCAPNVEALREVGASLATHDDRFLLHQGTSNFRRLESNEDTEGEGVRVKGAIHVFCANGRGRSTAFVLVLLVMRGDCQTVEEALEVVRRARPQINPKGDQIQVAREAVSIWRAEKHRVSTSSAAAANVKKEDVHVVVVDNEPQATPTRDRRVNSNAEVVTDDLVLFGEATTTADKAILKEEKIVPSSVPRKRGRQDRIEPVQSANFYCIVPRVQDNKATFTLRITRSDLSLIATEASAYPRDLQTGGDVFGKARDSLTMVAYHTIGPGDRAAMSERAFVQDAQYRRSCMIALGDLALDHLGEWHSHHETDVPSEGDVETIANLLKRSGKDSHLLIIANVLSQPGGKTVVAIGAYLFRKEMPREYDSGVIQIIEGGEFEHNHRERQQELEGLRGGQKRREDEATGDDKESESVNVIALT